MQPISPRSLLERRDRACPQAGAAHAHVKDLPALAHSVHAPVPCHLSSPHTNTNTAPTSYTHTCRARGLGWADLRPLKFMPKPYPRHLRM